MNVTLSLGEELVARTRELAQRRGTTLNQMIRDHLEELAGLGPKARALGRLEELWREPAGSSGGQKIVREDAYQERMR